MLILSLGVQYPLKNQEYQFIYNPRNVSLLYFALTSVFLFEDKLFIIFTRAIFFKTNDF